MRHNSNCRQLLFYSLTRQFSLERKYKIDNRIRLHVQNEFIQLLHFPPSSNFVNLHRPLTCTLTIWKSFNAFACEPDTTTWIPLADAELNMAKKMFNEFYEPPIL